MSDYKQSWLPHLKYSIPKEAYGYPISMYSIALEGWRRGLTLQFINKNRNKALTEFILTNQKRRFRFSGTRGNVISKEIINICSDKQLTKNILKQNKVRIIKGEKFHQNNSDEEIVEYVEEFGYPVVVKPHNGVSGEGVIININDELKLRKSLKHVRNKLGFKTVLIEEYISGNDYQLYIVGHKVVAACERMPAKIIGDGNKTINQLINRENKKRRNNPALFDHLINKKDEMLNKLIKQKNYTLQDVPEKNEEIKLNIKTNIAAGGETIDKTDKLPAKIKDQALEAAKSINNLPICAVELIYDEEKQKGYVYEVKTQGAISGYLFPYEGKPRDVPKEIIDYFFPETKELEKDTLHYFDLASIYHSFSNNVLQSFTIPKLKLKEKQSKKFIIKGLKHRGNYIREVYPKLLKLELNGFIKYRSKGRLELVFVGSKESFDLILKAVEILKKNGLKIIESNWSKPVKKGLEVIYLQNSNERKKRLQKRITSKHLETKENIVFKAIKNLFLNKPQY